MKFKIFISIWLIVVVSLSLILVSIPRIFLNKQNEMTTYENREHHFSVRWMGFLPSYSNLYPDYYVCINNLAGDSWTMGIGFQIKNQEDKGYYFQIGQNATPPAGWTLPTVNLSFVAVDQTLLFTYNASRTKIASIPQGELVEQVPLIVKAYNDTALTQLYSQDSFNVTFRFLDYGASVWSILYNDNFDDKTVQGWAATDTTYFSLGVSNDYYRSYPYSLKLIRNSYVGSYSYECAFRKSFAVASGYSKAYLIFSLRSQQYSGQGLRVYYGGIQYFGTNVAPTVNVWYQFAVPIPVGLTTQVDIYSIYGTTGISAYMDDVYVIAK